MSKTVGMGVTRKAKAAEAELKKEIKKLTAANKALQKENEDLRGQIEALQAAAGAE